MVPQYPLPDYLTKGKFRTEHERLKAYSHFWVRLAALYADPSGSVVKLSDRLPMNKLPGPPQTLRADQLVNPTTAIAIEKVVGRHLFPRELLRPDVFDIGE